MKNYYVYYSAIMLASLLITWALYQLVGFGLTVLILLAFIHADGIVTKVHQRSWLKGLEEWGGTKK